MIKDINGQKVEVREIEPILSTENFNEYQLPTGEVLKIKTVLTALYQSVDKINGEWVYSFDMQPVIRVIKS